MRQKNEMSRERELTRHLLGGEPGKVYHKFLFVQIFHVAGGWSLVACISPQPPATIGVMMSDEKKVEIREKLIQTRSDLLALLAGLDEGGWQTAVQSEDAEWTVADMVRHLMNAEKGMTGLIQQFQQGNDPVPPDFDRDKYNVRSVEKTQELSTAHLLSALETNHRQLLEMVDSLEPDDWAKQGRHANLSIMTIEEVCRIIAYHENLHMADIKQAVGR
jgi:uncharacterized protein (TIGR03083 family)